MMISFTIYGHKNLKATHKNTLEFTKDAELSPKGDCILGIRADYNLNDIKEFIKGKNKLKCVIEIDRMKDEFEFILNPRFNDKNEMVFRLGEFASERTLGLRASKAAKHIKREIVEKLKNPSKKAVIYLQQP